VTIGRSRPPEAELRLAFEALEGEALGCPKCGKSTLLPGSVEGADVWHCTPCNGFLVDRALLLGVGYVRRALRVLVRGLGILVGLVGLLAGSAAAQTGPNPYRPVGGLQAGNGPGRIGETWAKLPGGRPMGSPGGLNVDVDGEHLWAIVRCGNDGTPRGSQTYCDGSDLDPILRFDPDGNVVAAFGSRMFSWPHGLHVDVDGNVWVTEAGEGEGADGRPFGHQVFKFSPDGRLLMTLGEAGVSGDGPSHFTAPSDVVTNPAGEIFVVDGHAANGNNRIVKYAADGTFILEFGGTGYGPGELRGPHAIAMAPDGRLFVADRQNQRIVIFDQDGNYLSRWTQFGMPSDIWISPDGTVYVADSESDMNENPGWEKGIRIGDVDTGWVEHFILDPGDNPPVTQGGSGAESLTVDRNGSIYAGEPRPQRIIKYLKVR
jgi:sugar lactone lactonase YvrE